MKQNAVNKTIGIALSAVCATATTAPAQQITGTPGSVGVTEYKNRSNLPMPNTIRPSLVTYDAKSPDTKYPPIEQLRPPKGAPNVLIVLIDDAGFGSSSAFGGPCQTPTAENWPRRG
jgi:arylsulfatase